MIFPLLKVDGLVYRVVMRKSVIAAQVGVVALLVGGMAVGAFAFTAPTPEPAVSTVTVGTVEPGGLTTPTPEPTITPVPIVEAPVIEPAPVEAPAGPTLCPDGWFPNSVDGAGNESNCAQGQDDQPCVAYDDNNNCTAYYKP